MDKQKEKTIKDFRFDYKSNGFYWTVIVTANSLNDAMVRFATRYHNVDQVNKIIEI